MIDKLEQDEDVQKVYHWLAEDVPRPQPALKSLMSSSRAG